MACRSPGIDGPLVATVTGRPVPKYQAIEAELRRRIDAGDYEPGSRLPAQDELAAQFGVTLMTLRQAIASLEASGLVRAARGKGTFVADRPVDIRYDNLSSFVAQMRAAGVDLTTEILGVDTGPAARWPAAAAALGLTGDLACLSRRRLVDGLPLSLQRSFLDRSAIPVESLADLGNASLYDLLADAAGWEVAEARETITAVGLSTIEADALEAEAGHAAIRSTRTSLDQLGRPFLYDEALLVGGRCTITADRTSDRLSLRYGLADAGPQPGLGGHA